MATKGYILKVLMPSPEGEYVTNVHDFKKMLLAMQTPEEEIDGRIRAAVQYQRGQIVALGFSEEEADAKIEELIKEEIDGVSPKEEVVAEEAPE
jgi:hypothetical protein